MEVVPGIGRKVIEEDSSVLKEASSPGGMASTESEVKNTIEEKVDGTQVNATTTEESKGTGSASDSSEKKTKKDPSNDKGKKGNMKDDPSEKDSINTEKTAPEGGAAQETKPANNDPSAGPVVSSSKRTRPPYKYDPEKITLRFLIANRDGLTITAECKPSDTIGEIKGQLLSVWPEGKTSQLICSIVILDFIYSHI